MIETSIVLPAYNNEETIAAAIESVLAQTYRDWELLTIDDGSTDRTRALLTEYARRDSRIHILAASINSGAGPARNLGIKSAAGRYIAFLDADDTWHPIKLERQIAFMKDRGCVVTFTYYRRIVSGEIKERKVIKAPSEIRYQQLLKSNWIPMSSAVYDKNQAPGLRMRPLRRRQDYLFWLDLLSSGGIACCVPECLMTYTVRTRSVSSNKFASIHATWRLYRVELGLSRLSAAYYFAFNLAQAVFKRV